jgi:hypothetical protein
MEGQTLGFEQNATANELSSYLLLFNFDWGSVWEYMHEFG